MLREFKVKIGDWSQAGDEDAKNWHGTAVIAVPDEATRMEQAALLGKVVKQLMSDKSDKAPNENADDRAKDDMDAVKKLYTMARTYLRSISVTVGKLTIADVEELSFCEEWTKIAIEIAKVVANGPKLTMILRDG